MKIRRILVALAAGMSFAAVAQGAEALHVTSVSVSSGMAAVTLNDALALSNIKVENGAEGTLAFPAGIENVSSGLQSGIRAAIASGPSQESGRQVSFTVGEVSFSTASAAGAATSVVSFNESLSVLCRINAKDAALWILWPENFRLLNPALRKAVERSVTNKFRAVAGNK